MDYVKHTNEVKSILTALEWLEFCIENKTAHHISLIDMIHYTISVYSAPEADYIFNHSKCNAFTSMSIVSKEGIHAVTYSSH